MARRCGSGPGCSAGWPTPTSRRPCSVSRSRRRSAVAPTAMQRAVHPQGERAMAPARRGGGRPARGVLQRRHAVRRPRRTAPGGCRPTCRPSARRSCPCSRRRWQPGRPGRSSSPRTRRSRARSTTSTTPTGPGSTSAGGGTNFAEPGARPMGARPRARRRRLAPRPGRRPGGGQGRAPRRRRGPLPRRGCCRDLRVQPRGRQLDRGVDTAAPWPRSSRRWGPGGGVRRRGHPRAAWTRWRPGARRPRGARGPAGALRPGGGRCRAASSAS